MLLLTLMSRVEGGSGEERQEEAVALYSSLLHKLTLSAFDNQMTSWKRPESGCFFGALRAKNIVKVGLVANLCFICQKMD